MHSIPTTDTSMSNGVEYGARSLSVQKTFCDKISGAMPNVIGVNACKNGHHIYTKTFEEEEEK